MAINDLSQETLTSLNDAYNLLKPIAARSAMIDSQNLAKIMMRLIEDIRGDKEKTALPSYHHV